MSKGEIHIGKLIKSRLKNSRRTKKWFAEKIDCCRTNVYKILDKPSIDTAQLQRISLALRKNFFADLAEFCQKKLDKMDDAKS